ncbi:MAG TPA: hypothetical protein VMA77_11815 [Solirubrobacteraceae bacterium]|nr:hypothetical protein [Solirubrobacteraceae bacterium]
MNVSVLVAPALTDDGLKPALSVGGAAASKWAVAGAPVPPSLEDAVVRSAKSPSWVAATLTEIVHEAPLARLPPVRLTICEPAIAVAVLPF